MNILYVVHDNKKGGAALSFLEMISVIRNEHNVYVVTPHKNGFLPQQLDGMRIPHFNAHFFWWEIELPTNKLLARLKLYIYKMLNIWNYFEAHRLMGKLRNLNIDIIHSNSSVINFGALLSKTSGIRHIWHLRENGEQFGLNKVVSPNKYKNIMNSFASAYIAISQSMKNEFSKIVDEKKIYKIYNGVSEKFDYNKFFMNKANDSVKFLISGNYCREKGQEDVVRAVACLRESGINNFTLYLAGNGNFSEPLRLVEQYGLKEQVVFCGCVDDMIQLRKNVDVEIVASKYEAFGRVTIEAMRMSNSVIGTDTGGTPELINDGYNGFLFEYGNYKQLAEHMKKFICNRELVAKMGRNAYISTKDMFTPEENARSIMMIYEKIHNNTL